MYKSINYEPLRDTNLTWKARGILSYLMTCPDGWRCQVYDLINQSEKDGPTAVRAAIKELIKAGYLELRYYPKKDGKFQGSYYHLTSSDKDVIPKKPKKKKNTINNVEIKSPIPFKEQYNHPNWQRIRLKVMERDGFKCQKCGDEHSLLHVHHKKYVQGKMVWEYSLSNLITLCDKCHEKSHNKPSSK